MHMTIPQPAKLSTPQFEVLKALALGVQLQNNNGKWTFVGPWQIPAKSGIPNNLANNLVKQGWIAVQDGAARITDAGSRVLDEYATAALEDALSCLPEAR